MAVEFSFHAPTVVEVTFRERGQSMLTHSKVQQVKSVPQGSTATIIRGRFVDEDGNALDLSGATGPLYFHASTQDHQSVTYQGVAAYDTDGTDGKVKFSLTSTEVGTVRKLVCEFEVQGYNGGNLVGETFLLPITQRAAVAP